MSLTPEEERGPFTGRGAATAWSERVTSWQDRDFTVGLTGSGAYIRLYMQLRTWMGTCSTIWH